MSRRPIRAMNRASTFSRMARCAARLAGHPATFLIAVGIVLAWAALGPVFDYSDTWQLVINTGTTIITFLMVFLIQHSQNRDSEAVQLKLDELIWSLERAHNALLDVEELGDEDIRMLKRRYLEVARAARDELRKRPPKASRDPDADDKAPDPDDDPADALRDCDEPEDHERAAAEKSKGDQREAREQDEDRAPRRSPFVRR